MTKIQQPVEMFFALWTEVEKVERGIVIFKPIIILNYVG